MSEASNNFGHMKYSHVRILTKTNSIEDGRGVHNWQFEHRVFYRWVDIQTANFTCLTKT
jgi:hypothetical protein